ncbi:MAG: lytic transglycosylase, partial [Gammaproteobacteria bacterium]
RQESAFRPLVTSPAGARGLMQLMPATAKEVARKHRIPYKNSQQLFDPDLNIRLGSQYYADVLQRFGGNRILTTAAYNAGPHRVSRWRKKSAGKLPFDAWVETIPFKETRQYVQNVLSFAVIYSILLDQDDPLLSAKERGQQL